MPVATAREQTMEVLAADWPAPPGVRAFTSLRRGGVSQTPYDSLNVAQHVGDDPVHVAENRRRLLQRLALRHEPFWLEQVHGNRVLPVAPDTAQRQADASFAAAPAQACAVMTADCLPVLFAAGDGSCVAAAHAGWRGLADGVLEATVVAMQTPPSRLLAWLGPAIGSEHFEVGDEVREAFMRIHPAAAAAFVPNARGRWQANLYLLARQHLQRAGVEAIYGGERCTYREAELFFSHRRDGRCGRMVSLIWIDD